MCNKNWEIIKIMLENNELSLSDIEELEKILQAKNCCTRRSSM